MRVLASEISVDHWQWILEDRRTGQLVFGVEQNRVDIRQAVFEAILTGWALWDDQSRELVMDMMVRDHFEYWDKDGNIVL